jgi:tetratricopeptide (TPR) repeat protein
MEAYRMKGLLNRLFTSSLALSLLVFTGCFSIIRDNANTDLFETLKKRLSSREFETLRIPYACTPEMEQFARNVTKGIHSHVHQALAIVDSMLTNWNLEYDMNADLTAEQAFSQSRANCLTFTNLFVALSRSLGMKTVYIDVPQVDNMFEEDSIIINSDHICAGLYDGGQLYLIDFSPQTQRNYRVYHEIDDLEAIANYYNNTGYRMAHRQDRDLELALNYYNLAIRVKPDFTRALNNKGVTLSMLGDLAGAERQYRSVLEIDPDMPESNWNLSGLMYALGKYDSALPFLEKAVAGMPRNANYQYRLGCTYLKLKIFDKAEKAFKVSIRADPDFARSYVKLGLILEKQDKFDLAFSKYEQALKLDPALQDAQAYRTDLLLRCVITTL